MHLIKSSTNSGIKNLLEFIPFWSQIKRKYYEEIIARKMPTLNCRDNIVKQTRPHATSK